MKHRKKIMQSVVLLLSLFFGTILSMDDVEAAVQPDWYVKRTIEENVSTYSSFYRIYGYFYYQSYYYNSNPSTYYEGGTGRWSDSKPKIGSSLYNPNNTTGYLRERDLGIATDWGFSTYDTWWAGSKGYSPNGVSGNSSVRYSRFTKREYRRNKTSPQVKGIDQVNGAYAKGSNYWVAPNDTVQIRVRGYQTWNGYGKDIQLDDYVGSNNLRLVGGDQDIRSAMYRDGRINNFRTDSDAKISKHSSSVSGDKRTLYSKFNVVAKRGAYNIHTYATSENGKTQGYVDTGKDLRVDASAPDRKDASVYDARYVDGKNHWYKSGDSFRVRLVGYDKESEMRNTNLRLYGDGNDNRAVHYWDQYDGYVNEFNSGEYTDITSGTSPYLGWTAEYIFGGKIHSNIGNRTFQVQDFFEDNVRNSVGYTDTGLRIKTDDSAPSANRVWIDNVTQDDFYVYIDGVTDGQSGVKEVRFPTWTNADGQDDLNSSWKTNSANLGEDMGNGVWRYKVVRSTHNWEFGTYTIHPYVYDNVGNQKSYAISYTLEDKVDPELSVSLSPTSWTNGNVTATISAKDEHTGIKSITMPNGTVVAKSSEKGETISDTYSISSNGTYTFKTTDQYDNVTSKTVTVSNIDKTAPTAIPSSSTAWTNGNVSINWRLQANGGSPLKQYRTHNGSSWSAWTTISSDATITQVASSNGTYQVQVQDQAGNVSQKAYSVSNIDRTVPSASGSSPTAWTNSDVSIRWRLQSNGGSPLKRYRTYDGSWSGWKTLSGDTTISQVVSSNGTYQVQVEDQAGNVYQKAHTVLNIDKVDPTASGSSSTTWTNGDMNVSWKLQSNGGSPLKRYRTYDGGWSAWTTISGDTTINQTVTSNKTVHVQVEDAAGNVHQEQHTVSYIDKTAPNATPSASSAWTNGNVSISWRLTSGGQSPLKQYRLYNGSNWGSWTALSGDATITQVADRNTTYHIQVQDVAGNIVQKHIAISSIDRTKPTVSGSSSTAWTNSQIAIKWSISDFGGAGLKRYQIYNGSSWSGWVTQSSNTTVTQTVSSNGTYRIRVEDQAGNVTETAHTVSKIDKTNPYATGSHPTDWTNGTVPITWRLTSGGQAPLKQYRLYNGSVWGSWAPLTGDATITQTADKNATYHIQVQDQAGNITQEHRTVSNIDKQQPSMGVSSSNTDWTNQSITLKTHVSDSNTDANISGVDKIRMRVKTGSTYGAWGNWDVFGTSSTNSAETYYNTWTVHENGVYQFELVDRAGNNYYKEFEVKNIDKVSPTGSTSGQSGWTNGNVWIDVEGSDTASGTAKIEHVSGGTISGVRVRILDGTDLQKERFIATQNGTYLFRITDKAGNTKEVSYKVNTIDRVKPTSSYSINPEGFTNKPVTITWSVAKKAGSSGLSRARVYDNGWKAWQSVSGETDTVTHTATRSGQYRIQVEDRAGNVHEQTVTINTLETKAPSISVALSPNTWTNKAVRARISFSDNGELGVVSGIKEFRTKDASGSWSQWKPVSEATETSSNQYRYDWTISENGTYAVQVKDHSGNVAEKAIPVTIIDYDKPTGAIDVLGLVDSWTIVDGEKQDILLTKSDTVTLGLSTLDGLSGVSQVVLTEHTRNKSSDSWVSSDSIVLSGSDLTGKTLSDWTYKVKLKSGLESMFTLKVIDKAGNESPLYSSESFRQSNIQLKSFSVLNIVNPENPDQQVVMSSDIESLELTAGGRVTIEPMYKLDNLSNVRSVNGSLTVLIEDGTYRHEEVVDFKYANLLTDKTYPRFEESFVVPKDAPIGTTVSLDGNITVTLENGVTHSIYFPDQHYVGDTVNNIEQGVRFKIIR